MLGILCSGFVNALPIHWDNHGIGRCRDMNLDLQARATLLGLDRHIQAINARTIAQCARGILCGGFVNALPIHWDNHGIGRCQDMNLDLQARATLLGLDRHIQAINARTIAQCARYLVQWVCQSAASGVYLTFSLSHFLTFDLIPSHPPVRNPEFRRCARCQGAGFYAGFARARLRSLPLQHQYSTQSVAPDRVG